MLRSEQAMQKNTRLDHESYLLLPVIPFPTLPERARFEFTRSEQGQRAYLCPQRCEPG
jgi:hypothetical protein